MEVKILGTRPETKENLEFLAKARAEAEERSRLLTPEEKQKRAEATFIRVRDALMNGRGRFL